MSGATESNFSHEEEEDARWGDWPFPAADPFEPAEAPAPVATVAAQAQVRQLEALAHSAELKAVGQRAEAQARQRQARALQSPRSVSDLLRQHQRQSRPLPKRAPDGYRLTPESARNAMVYAELLGPCKAEREEEWRW